MKNEPVAGAATGGQIKSPVPGLGRRLLSLCWKLLLCYVAVSIMFSFLETKLIFHPTRADQEWLDPPNSRVQDVFLKSSDGNRIHAWWCAVEGWTPEQGATLYCHGNALNLSHRGLSISRWLEHVGLPVLIFDYPGYGHSEGRPTEAGCYQAADAAYDWLTNVQKIPPERIVLYGGSLGGAVAVELASRRPHRAIVLVSAFTSVADMARKLYPWLLRIVPIRTKFDNLSKIDRCRGPLLMAHGTADRIVPFEQSQRLFAAAREPKEFFTLEGYDHNHTPPPAFYGAFKRLLDEVERPRKLGRPAAQTSR